MTTGFPDSVDAKALFVPASYNDPFQTANTPDLETVTDNSADALVAIEAYLDSLRYGMTEYRIFDGMSANVNTVWNSFWTDTDPAILRIGRKATEYNLNSGTNVECTGAAGLAPKVVIGNDQEVYTQYGSLLWRGGQGATGFRTLFIHGLYYSAPVSGAAPGADGLGAGLVIQNSNFNYIDLHLKYTQLIFGTYGGTGTTLGQAEFNRIRLDMQNCDMTSPLWLKPEFDGTYWGGGSMRATEMTARIFGTSAAVNGFRCSMSPYFSTLTLHTGGMGVADGGSASGNPTTDGYTGADAIYWFEDDANSDQSIHGARIYLRDERGSGGTGVGRVGLWIEDNGSARRQEYGFIDFHANWAYDYFAVTDLDSDKLPYYRFGINQQTQPDRWTHATESWSSTVDTNLGGPALLLE